MNPQVLICCGAGGVGKTTLASALAVGLARRDMRVVALTIDPSRRLADALGIDIAPVGSARNQPQPIDIEAIAPRARGTLSAMVLDVGATFDQVVSRHASSEEIRDRILGNHYYRFVSTRLPGSHEFMAMERLYQLCESGDYDYVVVDTPPSRNAMDFLTAPRRMANLMEDGVLHWLTLPGTSQGLKLFKRGFGSAFSAVERIMGARTLGDSAEFFSLFAELWEGFRERATQVEALLQDARTSFFVVSTSAPAARTETLDFLDTLEEGGLHLHGLLLNRVVEAPQNPEALDTDRFPSPPEGLEKDWPAIVEAVAQAPARQHEAAQAESQLLQEIIEAAAPRPAWRIPRLSQEIDALRDLGELLPYLEGPLDSLRSPPPRSEP